MPSMQPRDVVCTVTRSGTDKAALFTNTPARTQRIRYQRHDHHHGKPTGECSDRKQRLSGAIPARRIPIQTACTRKMNNFTEMPFDCMRMPEL
jgi:hypothetical protein